VLPKFAMKLAGIVAERCVESVRVVVIAVPPTSGLRITFELELKFVPVTVIGWLGVVFTGALVGDTLEIVGARPRTVNGNELVVFAPSFTLTCTRAPAARSAALIAAASCVELVKVVVRGLHPHITVELPVKPVPVTVRVVAVPGAVAVNGDSLLIPKAGVFGPGPKLMSHIPLPCVAARSVRDGL